MKTFVKLFLTIAVSVFAIVSFIRFDFNVAEWGDGGRGAYTFFVLLFSFVGTAIIEASNETTK